MVASVFTVLMAITRVDVGAHYPATGRRLAIGGRSATAGWFVVVPVLTRLADWLAGTPLRPLVMHAKPAVAAAALRWRTGSLDE